MFPSLAASAIADALRNAGGDVQHAVDALLKAGQVKALCQRQPYASEQTADPDPRPSDPSHHFASSRNNQLCPPCVALVHSDVHVLLQEAEEAQVKAAAAASAAAAAVAAKKAEAEEAAKKKAAEEQAAAAKKAEEQAADKMKAEAEEAAKKKANEQVAAKIKAEEAAAMKKADEEQASAEKSAEAEEAAKNEAEAASKIVKEEEALVMPKKKSVCEWTVDEVCTFFTELKLGEYIAAITENEVDGEMLQDLLAGDGLGDLGIKSMVHALRIKRGLKIADKMKAEAEEAAKKKANEQAAAKIKAEEAAEMKKTNEEQVADQAKDIGSQAVVCCTHR
jgi:hypothetical protein